MICISPMGESAQSYVASTTVLSGDHRDGLILLSVEFDCSTIWLLIVVNCEYYAMQ